MPAPFSISTLTTILVAVPSLFFALTTCKALNVISSHMAGFIKRPVLWSVFPAHEGYVDRRNESPNFSLFGVHWGGER